jgi:hypothetical protein
MKRRFEPARSNEVDSLPGREAKGEMERLEFVQGNLIDVVERQKMPHREKLRRNPARHCKQWQMRREIGPRPMCRPPKSHPRQSSQCTLSLWRSSD